MTSRERVRRAIRFEEPDKIPIDWGMITLSGGPIGTCCITSAWRKK